MKNDMQNVLKVFVKLLNKGRKQRKLQKPLMLPSQQSTDINASYQQAKEYANVLKYKLEQDQNAYYEAQSRYRETQIKYDEAVIKLNWLREEL